MEQLNFFYKQWTEGREPREFFDDMQVRLRVFPFIGGNWNFFEFDDRNVAPICSLIQIQFFLYKFAHKKYKQNHKFLEQEMIF